jgi:hypothetical protein
VLIFNDNVYLLVMQLSQLGTLLIGSLGIGVALITQRRQLSAQMSIEFSRRFQDLLRMFPTDAWLANRNPAIPLPPPSQQITDCTLYCIQFIADVYYLRNSGYIPKKRWLLWEREIDRGLNGPVFAREWETVLAQYGHEPEFLLFINILVSPNR